MMALYLVEKNLIIYLVVCIQKASVTYKPMHIGRPPLQSFYKVARYPAMGLIDSETSLSLVRDLNFRTKTPLSALSYTGH